MSADTKSYYLFEPFNMNLKGARLGDLLDKEEQELWLNIMSYLPSKQIFSFVCFTGKSRH